MDYLKIIKNFKLDGEFIKGEPYGDGHINSTYAVYFKVNGKDVRYILQKVNSNVFPRTVELMENVQKVTEFMRKIIIANGGNPERETLTLISTRDGKAFYKSDEGDIYRVYIFIEDCVGLPKAESVEVFEGAGRGFGSFINKLNDFPAEQLHEVIFNFHNTAVRFDNFLVALDANFENRKESASQEIDFVLSRKKYCSKVVDMLAKGEIPLRVTHNDTKLNNVLMDISNNTPVCVIDLDTIMPGSLLYDFGDCIRSGCNTGLEDEQDLSKVGFDIELFEGFVKGFMDGIGACITAAERDMLAFGAILMTFECGMRFLTDYLQGDTYFKIKYPTHNLVRCRTQFKLVREMEDSLDKMNAIVAKYCKI